MDSHNAMNALLTLWRFLRDDVRLQCANIGSIAMCKHQRVPVQITLNICANRMTECSATVINCFRAEHRSDDHTTEQTLYKCLDVWADAYKGKRICLDYASSFPGEVSSLRGLVRAVDARSWSANYLDREEFLGLIGAHVVNCFRAEHRSSDHETLQALYKCLGARVGAQKESVFAYRNQCGSGFSRQVLSLRGSVWTVAALSHAAKCLEHEEFLVLVGAEV
uniref:Uncharacterized protein n=1 Tax=Ascaris lumbricoides TaxID=6252 RepID=A0A9J2P2F4_ASCLU